MIHPNQLRQHFLTAADKIKQAQEKHPDVDDTYSHHLTTLDETIGVRPSHPVTPPLYRKDE
jgi:hypothetical protein